MPPKAIPTPDKGNPLYPLPPDYRELTKEGTRLARINAASQWQLTTGSKTLKAVRYLSSMDFFDKYYLWPDEDAEFDPLFYDDPPCPTPTIHKGIVSQWAKNRASIIIAPRGSAKSTLMRKRMLMELITRPAMSIIYATSTGDNAKFTGTAMKMQFAGNQRLADDFGPEMGGRIDPPRGKVTFGTEYMVLNNMSWLRCISSESKQRGGRPRLYALDDPEYDPKAATNMALIRQYMETLIFKVVMPMIMRRGTQVAWLATFVSRRHYAWAAMEMIEDASGRARAKDPRFNWWTRTILRAEWTDENGVARSCWPEMWPLRMEDARGTDLISLEEIKEQIGTSNYLSEYMAQPGSAEDSFFPELTEDQHGYTIEDVDVEFQDQAWRSATKIKWVDPKGNIQLKDMRTFLNESKLFMTVDTSYTETRTSDYKVAAVMAVNADNELFVLDMWAGQKNEKVLVEEVFRLADKWRVPVVFPETVRDSMSLYHSLVSIVATRAKEMVGVEYLPKIMKNNPGITKKTAKIAQLGFRFDNGLIKLPLWLKNKRPWSDLYDQIEQFNPEAEDGGLAKDDHIDTISMSTVVIRGRMSKTLVETQKMSPLRHIARGDYNNPQGIPYASYVDFSRVDPEELRDIFVKDQHGPPVNPI